MTSTRFSIVFDLRESDRERVGQKARTLAALIQLGCPAAEGFVVSADACRTHFWRSGAKNLATEGITPESTAELRRMILREPLAPDVADAVSAAYAKICPGNEPVTVLPSAVHDEIPDEDLSAVYESVTQVSGIEAVLGAVKKVWSSMWTDEAVAIREQLSFSGEPLAGILVQRSVQTVFTGEARTADGKTGSPHIVSVSTSRGDEGTDEYFIDLFEHVIIRRSTQGQHVVTDEMILEAGELALTVDDKLGTRVEIEWAYDGERFVILSAQPLRHLPQYFPADWTVPGDEKLNWTKSSELPVSHFSRSLPIYSRVRVPTLYKPSRFCIQRRCHHGYIYTRIKWPAEKNGTSLLSKMAAGFRRSGEIRALKTLLAIWEEEIYPQVRKNATRLMKIDHSRVSLRKLRKNLKQAVKMHDLMLDWYDTLWYPSLRTSEMVEKLVRSVGGDDILFAKLFGDIQDVTAKKRSELFATAGELAKKERKENACLWSSDAEGLVSSYGYTYGNSHEMIDIAAWRGWGENPQPLISLLGLIAGSVKQEKANGNSAVQDAANALQELTRKMGLPGRIRARRLVRLARQWLPRIDERETMLAQVQSALRLVAMELGRRLVELETLSDPNDIFLFTHSELLSFPKKLKGEKLASLKKLAVQRKHQLWLDNRLDAPESLPSSSETRKAEVCIRDIPELVGIPCSPGVVVGTARVVESPEDANSLQPGEILITSETGLVWLPYLSLASAFVSEKGHWLSREAVIARDSGLPCVLCVRGAAGVIKTGDMIAVDGERGLVHRRHLASDAAKKLEMEKAH